MPCDNVARAARERLRPPICERLGIDCSTTASKVLAWDRDGKAAGEGARR